MGEIRFAQLPQDLPQMLPVCNVFISSGMKT